MANEHDLLVATLANGAADDGAGGLVQLTGRERPIVRWGDLERQHGPVVGCLVWVEGYSGGAPFRMIVGVQFDVKKPPGPDWDGVGAKVADRIRDVIAKHAAYLAHGLHVIPQETGRPLGPEEQGEGWRKIATYRMELTV